MQETKKLSRRRFLVAGCGALCAAALGSGCSAQTEQESQRTQSTQCPHGLVNDPYPGKCRRYVDKDENGICDLSEV